MALGGQGSLQRRYGSNIITNMTTVGRYFPTCPVTFLGAIMEGMRD